MMIFDYLENSYAKYPDKIAYADENKSMDYKTLHEHTYHIASVIAVALLIVLWVVPYLKSLYNISKYVFKDAAKYNKQRLF